MAHQLWVSPITGYRRKGTRLSDLRSLIQDGITARAILEPLESCGLDAQAGDMRSLLDQRGFDRAGVRDGETVVGFVVASELTEGRVYDHTHKITSESLISEATPLAAVLLLLKSEQSRFVLIEDRVEGIVTRADLNKPPIRIYLFGLISLLEMHLTYWVGRAYPSDSWSGEISDGRLDLAKNIQSSRRTKGEDPKLIDCLQLCDKRKLFFKTTDTCKKLGLVGDRTEKKFLEDLEGLRDVLAHSQADLAEGSTWEKRIELIHWAESLVARSDDLIESFAKSSSKVQVEDNGEASS